MIPGYRVEHQIDEQLLLSYYPLKDFRIIIIVGRAHLWQVDTEEAPRTFDNCILVGIVKRLETDLTAIEILFLRWRTQGHKQRIDGDNKTGIFHEITFPIITPAAFLCFSFVRRIIYLAAWTAIVFSMTSIVFSIFIVFSMTISTYPITNIDSQLI